MANQWYQWALTQWQKWRREKPNVALLIAIIGVAILYYFIVLLPLNVMLDHLEDEINDEQSTITRMVKSGQEMLRLRQAASHGQMKPHESTFTLVNQAINEQGWNDLVSDVHQIEENRVQMTLNTISFKDLMEWLKGLFDKYGIFVLEANIQKTQPGVVQVTLILEGK